MNRADRHAHAHTRSLSCTHAQWNELHALLKDMAVKHGHKEYEPEDEDIKWVIKKATKYVPPSIYF